MDRKQFNQILLSGTDEEILRMLFEKNPESQGYPILRDVLNYRNTMKLVKTTWWLVIATWTLAISTLIVFLLQKM